MKNNAEQIKENYVKLITLIDDNFNDIQNENIKKLFNHFDGRLVETPASGRPSYHNCWPGGWLDHTLRVIETSLKVYDNFVDLGVEVTTSKSEIVLSAMFHDLGKLGDLDEPYYIYQTDDWRRRKLNEHYVMNNKLEPMSVTDRSLWLLQHFNVDISSEVWKAIKMSDGMFDKGNEDLFRRSTDSRNILHYIVHLGDWTATIAEKQHHLQYNNIDEDIKEKVSKSFGNGGTVDQDTVDNMKSKFDELFTS